MRRFLSDIRNLVIILLAALFLIKISQEGERFIFWVAGGVAASCIFDFLINIIFFKSPIFPKSAVITGFIVAGILDYSQSWYILVVFLLLAIASKYIVRFKDKHIFNPANLGLFAATVFKVPLTWKIESNILLIVIAGVYFAYRLKKYSHIVGYLFFFASLFFFVERANPFNMISWFFIFIMLIEPKTSGYGMRRGFLFGSIAGISSFLIFKLLPGMDFFVGSLLLANLTNPILEKIGG